MPDLDMTPRKWVYRLWDADGKCLYVGQHHGWHPSLRISQHRSKPWWPDVTRADYYEVTGYLDAAERKEIKAQQPVHNVALGGRGLEFTDWEPLWKKFRLAVKTVNSEMTASKVIRQFIRFYVDPWGDEELPPIPKSWDLMELEKELANG